MRSLTRFCLAAWLCLASGSIAFAQSAQSEGSPAADMPVDAPADTTPSGPSLQPADYAPVICDPNTSGFRYLEVRGSGFDAWATQRLVGNLLDGNGVPQVQWGSVWVSPQGRLTLEVNLCADPFRQRGALPAGTYTVAVGPGNGGALAATSIALMPPLDSAAVGDVPPPDVAVSAPAAATPTPMPFVLPSIDPRPTSTPLPPITLPAFAPTPTPTPRTGPGTRQQPFPLGAPGLLADGWQLIVTGVTPDAWSGIHSAVPSSVAPASDQRDFMVRVEATYTGQGTGVFSAMRLALQSGVNTTYDQLHNGCGIVPDMVPPNLVTSGGSLRGNVCFTVRASDVDSLVLFDNQTADNDHVYFLLK
ncbi:MAG TPA: hypothetical protein VGQ62_08065 [Chloroflexota bacterium]|nr:hypothetical protein [Chloroflexota bacterium]